MGVLDIQAGVAMLYFKMKQTCEIVFVIDRIGGSFKVLSYSSHRFHEKERYEERDQGPMSTEVGERIGGRYEERDQGPMSTVVGERIGGRSATVPHHTHLHLKSYLILPIDFTKKNGMKKETKDQCQLK